MSVGTIGNLSINAYTNYITLTFAKPSNTTKYVISLTDVVHGYNPTPITIYASAFGSTITFDFPGLNPGYKYYVYVTPYNGSVAGITKQYQNASSQNLVILPVSKTTIVPVTPTGSNNNNTQNPGPGPATTKSPTGGTFDGGIITPSPSAGANTPTKNPPADIASSNRVLVDVTTELSPNQSYDIKVRAVSTDSSGNTIFSEWSNPFNLTTPAFSASGANFNSPNVNTNTQLSGGAVYAGTFSNAGSIDVVSGVTTGTGVVLNQTGLAAFNNGTKEFYIDALTGNAYFAGEVTAGTIKIGPGVGPAGQNGIYINSKNYWYDSGSFSANSIDVAGTLLNTTDPASIPKPNTPTGLTSSWSGTTLNITWSWTAGSPDFSKDFILSFTEGSTTKSVIVPLTQNSYSFSLSENKAMFGIVSTSINLSIIVEDRFGNKSNAATATAPTYVSNQIAPVISATAINNGYSVSYAAPTDSLTVIEISESTTSSTTGYSVVYSGTLNPTTILASNLNQRWVKARFIDAIGVSNGYSNIISVTPTSSVVLNTNTPNEVNSVSTAFKTTTSGANTSDDIGISITTYSFNNVTATGNGSTMTYTTSSPHGFVSGDQLVITNMSISQYNVTAFITVPTGSNTTFQISGTATGSGTGGVAQYISMTYIVKLIYTNNTSKVGYFYFSPDGSNDTSQSFTITKFDLFNQFGTHYSSFSGLLISVNASGIRSSGKTISLFSRTSSINSFTPTISSLNVADGYQLTFDFSLTNATNAEIYQKRSSWSTITIPVDYFTGTAVSGSSGSPTLVITNVKDVDLNVITTAGDINGALPTGYQVTGNNIPNNTYVTAVSYSSPNFTLTLNNNLIGVASGSYKINGLVYSGLSPASINNNLYEDFYVLARFYDDYDNAALISNIVTVHPVDPAAISSITNAVQVSGTSGAVYVGDASSSGKRVVIKAIPTDPYVGIFAYDGTNTAATTSIIANPTLVSSGGYTFKTTAALIGDWSINDTKIQNTLGTSSNYVGLSATGTYSFWAGSGTSGGDSSANFLVTPTGQVTARKISIIGDGTSSDLINAGGGVFKVSGAGALTATSAIITGNITAHTGNFTGNVGITSPGSLYSGIALTQTITAVSPSTPSAGTVRYTLSASHSLTTNSTVYITGITPSGYNGTFKVTAVNVVANSFEVANSTTGTATISTTPPIAQVIDITTGYILNSNGIVFNTSGTKGITTIDSSTGLLTTKSANIGGWLVGNPNITATSGTGTITLDSTNARISANTTSGGSYYVGMAAPTTNSSVVIWAGNAGVANTSNAFTVLADGTVKIGSNATINGVAASTVTSGAVAGSTALQSIPSNYLTTSTSISGGQITTGTIKNGSFSGTADGTNYSSSGMAINLDNASITSPYFTISSTGANFKGAITGGTITIGSSGSTPYLNVSSSGITIQGYSYTSQYANNGTPITVSTPSITMSSGKLSISNVDYMGDLGNGSSISATSFVRLIASNPGTAVNGTTGNLERGPAIYYNTVDPSNSGFIGDIWFTYA